MQCCHIYPRGKCLEDLSGGRCPAYRLKLLGKEEWHKYWGYNGTKLCWESQVMIFHSLAMHHHLLPYTHTLLTNSTPAQRQGGGGDAGDVLGVMITWLRLAIMTNPLCQSASLHHQPAMAHQQRPFPGFEGVHVPLRWRWWCKGRLGSHDYLWPSWRTLPASQSLPASLASHGSSAETIPQLCRRACPETSASHYLPNRKNIQGEPTKRH